MTTELLQGQRKREEEEDLGVKIEMEVDEKVLSKSSRGEEEDGNLIITSDVAEQPSSYTHRQHKLQCAIWKAICDAATKKRSLPLHLRRAWSAQHCQAVRSPQPNLHSFASSQPGRLTHGS